jgi:hypothetical protein
MNEEKTCMNCKWSKWNGPHLGCYYKYKWRGWLKQNEAKLWPLCETTPMLQLEGCKWEEKK